MWPALEYSAQRERVLRCSTYLVTKSTEGLTIKRSATPVTSRQVENSESRPDPDRKCVTPSSLPARARSAALTAFCALTLTGLSNRSSCSRCSTTLLPQTKRPRDPEPCAARRGPGRDPNITAPYHRPSAPTFYCTTRVSFEVGLFGLDYLTGAEF